MYANKMQLLMKRAKTKQNWNFNSQFLDVRFYWKSRKKSFMKIGSEKATLESLKFQTERKSVWKLPKVKFSTILFFICSLKNFVNLIFLREQIIALSLLRYFWKSRDAFANSLLKHKNLSFVLLNSLFN